MCNKMSFALPHCENIAYILTMRQCKKLSRRSFVAIVERRSHCFSPISLMALCVDCVRVPVPSSRLSSSKQYSTFIESGLAGISSAVVQGRVYRLSGNQRRSRPDRQTRRAQCDVDLTTDVTWSAARRHASLCVWSTQLDANCNLRKSFTGYLSA